MQRWIVAGVVVVLLGIAGFFGARTAWRAYNDGKPAPVWVPLAVNPDTPIEQQDKTAKELGERLHDDGILLKLTKELNLRQTWSLPDDEAASKELGRRMFVRTGTMDSPKGAIPAIHIGVHGKYKEINDSKRISERLIQEVWPILGIEPPTQSIR